MSVCYVMPGSNEQTKGLCAKSVQTIRLRRVSVMLVNVSSLNVGKEQSMGMVVFYMTVQQATIRANKKDTVGQLRHAPPALWGLSHRVGTEESTARSA